MKKRHALLAIVWVLLLLMFGCNGDTLSDEHSRPDESATNMQNEPDEPAANMQNEPEESSTISQSETSEPTNPVLGKWVGRQEITDIDWVKAGDVDKEIFMMHLETIENMEIVLELRSDGTYWMTGPGPIVHDTWNSDNGEITLASSGAGYATYLRTFETDDFATPNRDPAMLLVSSDGTTLTAENFGRRDSYNVVFFTIVFTRDTKL